MDLKITHIFLSLNYYFYKKIQLLINKTIMKKVVLPLLLICLSSASLSAQDMTQETTTSANDYNQWSIEVAGGINKPFKTFSPGYRTEALNFWQADLGVRYMFNNKFGLKVDFGYNKFQNADRAPEFDTSYLRADLQGVVNMGRVLNFEDWTNTFGLLAHGGFGVYQMMFDEDIYDGNDRGVNVMGGLTLQVKLSDRIVLTGDITGMANGLQNRSFDGNSLERNTVDGLIFNGSVGFTFYLGGAEQHADWVTDVKTDELAAMEERIGSIETQMNDSDKDGVPDYLDAEPNSITGVAVDSKGRTIDHNGNGVPDELESYIDAKNNEVKNSVSATGTDIVSLINGGYVNVYFDFNQDMPNEQSVSGINFLIKYLKENPSATADVIGYADEIGDTAYNKDLSQRRAQNVKQILVDSGIDASRMNIVGNGEDTSVNKDSKQARQVVRRVTFVIK